MERSSETAANFTFVRHVFSPLLPESPGIPSGHIGEVRSREAFRPLTSAAAKSSGTKALNSKETCVSPADFSTCESFPSQQNHDLMQADDGSSSDASFAANLARKRKLKFSQAPP